MDFLWIQEICSKIKIRYLENISLNHRVFDNSYASSSCIFFILANSLLMSGSSNEFLCRKWIRIHNYVSWLHRKSCKLRRKWKSRFGRLAKFQLGMQYCQYAWDLYKHSLYARLDWLYFGQNSMKVMNENTQTATHSFPPSFRGNRLHEKKS